MAGESEAIRREFPKRLLEEAARTPGGWVYETDGRRRDDGYVQIEFIIRGWKISPDGIPTGEVWENLEYKPK